MTQKVIQIPRINDGRADFATLFSIWSQTNDYFEDVRFDFSTCWFLRPKRTLGDRQTIQETAERWGRPGRP